MAACVGACPLAAVMRLLAQDHAGWAGGMPDLLLWCPMRCIARLAEVKVSSPGQMSLGVKHYYALVVSLGTGIWLQQEGGRLFRLCQARSLDAKLPRIGY